jgi:guanylate kinase
MSSSSLAPSGSVSRPWSRSSANKFQPEFSISYTTRRPRGAEQDGREYYFVTREQFEDMIAKAISEYARFLNSTITEQRAGFCSRRKKTE